uniref:Uncharacterized protein n=1 Tax=Kalanchoe fedtschenkoi TaxID=63787 RepID=A0A7N0ZW81_KALFE
MANADDGLIRHVCDQLDEHQGLCIYVLREDRRSWRADQVGLSRIAIERLMGDSTKAFLQMRKMLLNHEGSAEHVAVLERAKEEYNSIVGTRGPIALRALDRFDYVLVSGTIHEISTRVATLIDHLGHAGFRENTPASKLAHDIHNLAVMTTKMVRNLPGHD